MQLNRRSLLIGAGALGLAGPSLAQVPPEPPPIDEAALQMLSNLATRMTVGVGLNGRRVAQFVVDTGANRTALSAAVAEELGLAPGPEVVVHGVTSAEVTPTARLARLSVGGRNFHNLITPVFPRSRLGVDGLLGVDILRRFRVTFDVAGGTLRLGQPARGIDYGGRATRSRISGENRLSARHRYGQLTLIDVAADGVPVHAFVDSGAQYSVGNMALFRAVAARRPDFLRRRWTVPILGATGQTLTGELGLLRGLDLGTATIPELPVVFADLHAFDVWRLADTPALLMGADVLGLFSSVTLDYPERAMVFGRYLGARPDGPPRA